LIPVDVLEGCVQPTRLALLAGHLAYLKRGAAVCLVAAARRLARLCSQRHNAVDEMAKMAAEVGGTIRVLALAGGHVMVLFEERLGGFHNCGGPHIIADTEVPGHPSLGLGKPNLAAQDGFHRHPVGGDNLAAICSGLENSCAQTPGACSRKSPAGTGDRGSPSELL
jgi:hypothetical protein